MWSSIPYLFMCMFLLVFGTSLAISSSHWLSVWAGFEINLMGFLPLIIYSRQPLESESSVKYFIMQALGSGLLMLGSLYSFSLTFSWDFMDNNLFSLMSMFLILSSLMIKMGAFPFYYWVPSVMAGMSWFTCLILLTWQKVAPLFTMTTLLSMQNSYMLLGLICFSAVGSTLMGGLGGVNQSQLRALIAYSSIGHLGWMLFSLTMNSWLMMLYFIIYICVSMTVFVPLISMNLKSMKFLSSIYMNKYMLFGIFTSLLSLGSVPPLLGFISKWVVIMYCVNSAYYIILAIMIIGSLLSLFYYMSLVFSLCMNFMKYNSMSSMWLFSSIMYYWFSFMINMLGGCFFLLVSILN